jgi:hypothetical protein
VPIRNLAVVACVVWALGCGGSTQPTCPIIRDGKTLVQCAPNSNPKLGCGGSGCVDPHSAGWISFHGAYGCAEGGRLCSGCHTTATTGPGALCVTCHTPDFVGTVPCSF